MFPSYLWKTTSLFEMVDEKGDETAMYSESPDDDVYQFLARTYSFNHGKMHIYNETKCGEEEGFVDGITNGAEWYMIVGELTLCN